MLFFLCFLYPRHLPTSHDLTTTQDPQHFNSYIPFNQFLLPAIATRCSNAEGKVMILILKGFRKLLKVY